VAFLVGAFCSALAGFVGMYISVKANLRTAAAAANGGLRQAVKVGMRGGAVSGFLIVALSLLGVTNAVSCDRLLDCGCREGVPGNNPSV